MELIDFSKCEEKLNKYKGSEKKKTLIYNEKNYLVKFPDPLREKNKDVSYINNAFSEYIGSKIFELTGFKTQKVILGFYMIGENKKIVCACEDFTENKNSLYEFENLTISGDVDKKIETEISDIIEIINKNDSIIDAKKTLSNFWEMFIIDCLIGNTDRHNGNWGFLEKDEKLEIAPIYDCGSCLNPLFSDEDMEKYLKNETEMKNIALNTYSCLKENSKKINYSKYIISRKNKNCNTALKEIFENINIEKINEMIDEINCISNIRKEFYKKIIEIRYKEIVEKTYKKI